MRCTVTSPSIKYFQYLGFLGLVIGTSAFAYYTLLSNKLCLKHNDTPVLLESQFAKPSAWSDRRRASAMWLHYMATKGQRYLRWSPNLEYPMKECVIMAGQGWSGNMTHTFTSFIRGDEGLRESGCQDWQFILSPPNNTPSEHETAFCLFPPASTLAIWHATALMLSQMPMARVYRFPSTDYSWFMFL